MNRKSVIRSLRSGKRITHEYLGPDEWIKVKGDRIIDENGIDMGSLESFIDGADMAFENQWSIYKL